MTESTEAINVLFILRKIDCNDGIASYCSTLIEGLSSKNVRFYIVCGAVSFDDATALRRDELKQNSIEWIICPKLRQFPSLKELLLLTNLIRYRKIKIINVHGLSMLLWGRILTLLTGARLVATYHPSAYGDLQNVRAMAKRPLSLAKSFLLNLLFPDRLIVLSEESKSLLKGKAWFYRHRIAKISGGIDAAFRPPNDLERQNARARFGYLATDLVCLLAGRLSWNKGHDLLIEATYLLIERSPHLKLKCLFVGSGDNEEALKKLASRHDPNHELFNFAGFIDNVREAFWAADILVLPSRAEGFGLVVAEAMATGLVPIRTPSGGTSDQIIEGVTGLIVPFEDVDALAAAISGLANVARREAMAGKCKEMGENEFSKSKMVEKTKELYMSLL